MTGTAASSDLTARIQANPKYKTLVAKRTAFGWVLATLMFVAYYGYIGLIAFDKTLLGRPIGGGVTSLGIPVGIGLIVFTILITGVYVWRANREFDQLTREIVEEVGQ